MASIAWLHATVVGAGQAGRSCRHEAGDGHIEVFIIIIIVLCREIQGSEAFDGALGICGGNRRRRRGGTRVCRRVRRGRGLLGCPAAGGRRISSMITSASGGIGMIKASVLFRDGRLDLWWESGSSCGHINYSILRSMWLTRKPNFTSMFR